MALAHAILALLLESPFTGYDLTKTFAGSIGSFWKATHQQIYRELAKLEAQAWVTVETIPQAGRPDKKLYSITNLGRQKFVAWANQPCDVSAVKEELLVKVFAGVIVGAKPICQEIQHHRQLHAATLANYRQIEQQFFANCDRLSSEQTFPYLTLRRGIRYEIDWIEWCDEALECLRKGEG
ncbi:PadR family transcriptional regulator [Phormidium sp. CLA17]|uniref:PadR family transcriptional regulator n=1 Tax=Leptolyngbya sp. Cla-17 TaxID=2803751 RepID=UPI0014928572|nr:PadR family transcriptional regulator [Leptolyngbya sp. Cla-17]MBM0740646.1 PadR family transcriptional regulator [Leptolyngbya sp. Cla-17]